MINSIRAELFRVRKNIALTSFTIGLLPSLVFVLLNMLAILGALGLWITAINQVNWQEQVILTLLFANQLLSQALFIIFAAVSFGGESRWKTWKNIVPRRQRHQIVLGKIIVIALAILFATQSMALVTVIGSWEVAFFNRVDFVSGAWNDTGIPFASQYFWLSLSLFCNFMIAGLYASIAAIQFQSTSAGIVIGVIVAFTDSISQAAFGLIARLLKLDFITEIPSFLPNYNIQNMLSWITTGATVYRWNLTVSVGIVSIWIIAGIVLAVFLFQRRDID